MIVAVQGGAPVRIVMLIGDFRRESALQEVMVPITSMTFASLIDGGSSANIVGVDDDDLVV